MKDVVITGPNLRMKFNVKIETKIIKAFIWKGTFLLIEMIINLSATWPLV